MLRRSPRFVLCLLALLSLPAVVRPNPAEAKRRNPEVLAPVEFQADVARVCVHSYMTKDEDGTRLTAIIEHSARGKRVLWVEQNVLKQLPATEFARDVLPVWGAVVTASFPYRRQIEAFQGALHLHSVAELRDEPGAFPRFIGLSVERRETAPKETKWQALDFESKDGPYRYLVTVTREEFEPEPKGWEPVRVPGLAMPLPVLANGRYPECSLPLLKKTLLDPKARALPDYCLLRFIDFTVQPGHSYEYRVRVRMANPNHGQKARVEKESLAEPKELLGPWTVVPGAVAPGPDLLYYVADPTLIDPTLPGLAAGPDEVAFQFQRWMPYYEVVKGSQTLIFPVGGWVVAPRVLVSRGARVRGTQQVLLPIWSPEEGRYIEAGTALPDSPRVHFKSLLMEMARRMLTQVVPTGVTVDFDPNPKRDDAPLLVNFEGGKRLYRRVEARAPIEVLLLSPDGKLFARDSVTDATDPLRAERESAWRKWVREGKPPQ